MKRSNRTTLEEQPPKKNEVVLESKPSRGKHPNSRRKKGPDGLVKITRYVYARQLPISGEELREMIDLHRGYAEKRIPGRKALYDLFED